MTLAKEEYVGGDGAEADISKGKEEDEKTKELGAGVEMVAILKMSDDLNQTGVSADEKPDTFEGKT